MPLPQNERLQQVRCVYSVCVPLSEESLRSFTISVLGAVALLVAGCSSGGHDSADRGTASASSGVGAATAASAVAAPRGGTAPDEVARIMRTGIERVRASSSLRMVNTAETEGGSPSVIDSRIVAGKGSHTRSRQDGFSMEQIVIGDDVFTRDGGDRKSVV